MLKIRLHLEETAAAALYTKQNFYNLMNCKWTKSASNATYAYRHGHGHEGLRMNLRTAADSILQYNCCLVP